MNWKVFIVFHDKIYWELYSLDTKFSNKNYSFIKVGHSQKQIEPEFTGFFIEVLPNFKSLGKHYAEWEVIYNIYKHPELYENLDYIGFSQYDKQHKLYEQEVYNITELIEENLNENTHISLESHFMDRDFNQKILMDRSQPNTLVGNGRNCYYGIIEDYNDFFKTNHSLGEIINKKINLVSCFILPKKNFIHIMEFISFIIESKKLDEFDTPRQHRLQGGLLERYMGVALLFEGLNTCDLTIHHLNLK